MATEVQIVSISMPAPLKRAMVAAAVRDDRAVSQWVREAIRAKLAQEPAEQPAE